MKNSLLYIVSIFFSIQSFSQSSPISISNRLVLKDSVVRFINGTIYSPIITPSSISSVGSINFTGRSKFTQGTDVASAAGAITLSSNGNVFEITGTASITLISNVNWQNGSEVTLLFTSTATFTDGTANSGTDIGMELSGNTNFTASAGATITLILSEISGVQRWREKARSVN